MILKVLVAVLSVFAFAEAEAQLEPPVLRCANVLDGGAVELTWETPPNPPANLNYNIYRDQGAGFLLFNTVGPSTATNTIDGTANSEMGSVRYFIKSVLNGIEGPPSDTISTIYLTNFDVDSRGVVELNWNPPFPSSFSGNYEVWRDVNNAGYNLLNTLPAFAEPTYRDTLYGYCDSTDFAYTVRFIPSGGVCQMNSNETGGRYKDFLGPPRPEIETVLINPQTGYAELYWFPVSAPDLDRYRVQTAQNIFVGTIPAGQPPVFIYEDASLNASTTLRVIAYDVCDIEESFDSEATTIFLRGGYELCDPTATIEWNSYTGWDQGVEEYRIWVSVNEEPFEILTTLPSLGANMEHEFEIEPNLVYRLYIEAISNGPQRPSTSNVYEFKTYYPEVADFNYMNRVTTVNDDLIQIDLRMDPEAEGMSYELFRSRSGSAFQSMGTYLAAAEEVLTVMDNDVNADNTIYRYRWLAFDGCGREVGQSNISSNILLTANTGGANLINSLQWNDYIGWDGGVIEYRLYRKLGAEEEFSLYQSFGPNEFTFEEDVEAFLLEEGEFCYFIEAVEGSNQFGESAIAQSNTDCAVQDPLMWVPNTIVINGFNKIFKPVAGFIDFESYEMEVYNKWGERIFESSDVEEGWDGTHEGRTVPEDYYRYIISYRDGSGKPYLEQGVMYVLIGS